MSGSFLDAAANRFHWPIFSVPEGVLAGHGAVAARHDEEIRSPPLSTKQSSLGTPLFKGHPPSEPYYAARKPPHNPDDHKLDDPAKRPYYKRLQVNPFAEGQLYGDRVQGADFTAPRAVR